MRTFELKKISENYEFCQDGNLTCSGLYYYISVCYFEFSTYSDNEALWFRRFSVSKWRVAMETSGLLRNRTSPSDTNLRKTPDEPIKEPAHPKADTGKNCSNKVGNDDSKDQSASEHSFSVQIGRGFKVSGRGWITVIGAVAAFLAFLMIVGNGSS